VIVVVLVIGYDAVRRILEPEFLMNPGALALVVALMSVLLKEAIYQYTARAARRLRSNMLHANAWHSRSDAISSIVVAIGVGGAMLGYPYLDAIAAVAVALMIAKIGWDLLWTRLQEFSDTSLDDEEVEAIRTHIIGVHGVQALHMLRTRRSGADALIDVHILVDPALSVSEGHQIGEQVRAVLIDQIEDISDVTVHIDPEDDELAPCKRLPLRDEILQRLEQQWQGLDLGPGIDRVMLHYLDGKVHVDIFMNMGGLEAGAMTGLSERIRAGAHQAKDSRAGS